jgi:hypothetical protein
MHRSFKDQFCSADQDHVEGDVAMRLKGIEARIKRLEREIGREGCPGCTKTFVCRLGLNSKRDSQGEPRIEDWSATELARCPDCGNPEPKMTMLELLELLPELKEDL